MLFVTIMHPLFHIMIHLIFLLLLLWVLKWSSLSCLLFVTILLLVNNVIKIHIVQMVLNSGLFQGWLGLTWKCVTKIWVSHERKKLNMFETILHNKTSQCEVHIWGASCQCKRNKIKCSFTTLSCKYMYPSTLTALTLIILFSEMLKFSENISLKFVKEIRESLWIFYFQHEIFKFN